MLQQNSNQKPKVNCFMYALVRQHEIGIHEISKNSFPDEELIKKELLFWKCSILQNKKTLWLRIQLTNFYKDLITQRNFLNFIISHFRKKWDVKMQLLFSILVLEKYRGEKRFLPGFGTH